MRASSFVAPFICAAFAAHLSACATGYRDALGYRAHEAALRRDVAAFDALMDEAATTLPRHPLDNPKRTVLTHFLDLGASDAFFPTLERWKARGWVAEQMTCAIERARWRGVADTDPAEADRAAEACLAEAREGADDPERSWLLDACLEGAPFLTQTSTKALVRFVERAADPAEPTELRAALLDGMTHLFLAEPARLRENDAALDEGEATRRARRALEETRARFVSIVRAVKPTTDTDLLSRSTAFGALELERVSLVFGESFFERVLAGAREGLRYPAGINPADRLDATADDADLVWAWVRALKAGPRISRLDVLGLSDRRREPAEDAEWYACSWSDGASIETVEASRRGAPAEPCPARPGRTGAPRVVGPFPLQATALAAARRRDETPDHDHN